MAHGIVETETAKAGLESFFQNHARKPIIGVIYTHSHVDHFGGVRAL
jgi:alkyl sulfatase BDS1-like metallo-beta-lactamase superfamily hydrolase